MEKESLRKTKTHEMNKGFEDELSYKKKVITKKPICDNKSITRIFLQHRHGPVRAGPKEGHKK